MRRTLLTLISCTLYLVLGAGCSQASVFSGERAYRDVRIQCEFGPRVPGSEASRKTVGYISRELRRAGWAVEQQEFSYGQGGQGAITLRNVIGRRGQGPLVILGAHYDCRSRADRDRYDSSIPVPGANDGASGVAVLLELARSLDSSRLRNEVWLVFFDAEDQGELEGWPWSVGARHMAANLTRRPEMVIIVDMVGDADQQIHWEYQSTRWLSERVWSVAASLGYGAYFLPSYKHSLTDDHTPFLERAIPAIDIIDFDYPSWHTTADTPDKVSAASLERVGRTLEILLESAS